MRNKSTYNIKYKIKKKIFGNNFIQICHFDEVDTSFYKAKITNINRGRKAQLHDDTSVHLIG